MRDKIVKINLKFDMPTVDVAIQKMKNSLTTYKGQGYKVVIIIHGYGSSGVGGSIKMAVTKCLREDSMRGIVRDCLAGEQWFNRKREMLAICKDLENYEQQIANNDGVTVVFLR